MLLLITIHIDVVIVLSIAMGIHNLFFLVVGWDRDIVHPAVIYQAKNSDDIIR